MVDSNLSDIPPSDVEEIAALLDELETLTPANTEQPRSVYYRVFVGDEPVNDALDETEEMFDPDAAQEEWIAWQGQQQLPLITTPEPIAPDSTPVPLLAIDSGLAKLGETEDGIIIALRGTIVSVVDSCTTLYLYRTGPLYLRNSDRLHILHVLGKSLNKEDIFVELESGQPSRVKSGVADDAQRYSDRFRNWFERMLQRVAVQLIENGLVILDGALTLNTRDTPTEYLKELAKLADNSGNALIGVSKQSRLQVRDRSVRFWLSEMPNTPCYRRLKDLMSAEMQQRVMGSTYATRFSSMGPVFRTDVRPVKGQREDEALDMLFSSCLIRGGYPDILVRAHTHSYFTSPSVAELQAQCGARYSLRPEQDIELTGIFGPFGGRFK